MDLAIHYNTLKQSSTCAIRRLGLPAPTSKTSPFDCVQDEVEGEIARARRAWREKPIYGPLDKPDRLLLIQRIFETKQTV
jgi:hypothetical protein